MRGIKKLGSEQYNPLKTRLDTVGALQYISVIADKNTN